jgi:hypothetical protein
MSDITNYIILFTSIVILYLAFKHKSCPKIVVDPPYEPKEIRVSDIFRKMFNDREPVPGKISLSVDTAPVNSTPI